MFTIVYHLKPGWHDRVAHTYVVQLSANDGLIPVSQEVSIT